ncbi:MAG: shikimate kinase [Rhodospirillales bacterium]|nr:shikimate kinase [Rhodospirillales bacterium]
MPERDLDRVTECVTLSPLHSHRAPAFASSGRSVVLVGLMGCGKTRVGRELAPRLQLPFLDADAEIEAAAGCTVGEIFALYGEAHFRDGERRVMSRLMHDAPCILATGGGAFMDPGTRAVIARRGVSVWIKAELDLLLQRTARKTTRPLLRHGDPKAILSRLQAERDPIYSLSDICVESTNGPAEETADAILAALENHPVQPVASLSGPS